MIIWIHIEIMLLVELVLLWFNDGVIEHSFDIYDVTIVQYVCYIPIAAIGLLAITSIGGYGWLHSMTCMLIMLFM